MTQMLNALEAEQVQFFQDNGYLHLPGVFSASETDQLAEELDWQIGTWAKASPGWSGSWRRVYMDLETEKASKLVALHDLHRYSRAWCGAVCHSS